MATESTGESGAKKASAFGSAGKAIRAGSADARRKATEMAAATQEVASRTVYRTCYAISYTVVFPTVFLASFVPRNNPMVQGLIDGATVARESVGEIHARRASRREERARRRQEGAIVKDGIAALEAT